MSAILDAILPWNVPFKFPTEECLARLSLNEIAAASSVLAFLMNESYTNIEPSFSFSSEESTSLETQDEA